MNPNKPILQTTTALIVLVCCMTFFGIVGWWSRRHTQAERYFQFASDVGEYACANLRLPEDVEAFCSWKTDATGKQIWSIKDTKNKISFIQPINRELFLKGEQHFIVIKHPQFKQLAPSVHWRLIGAMGAAAHEFNLETGIRPYQDVEQTNKIRKVRIETE
jgi:hypothetical protein